MKCSTIPVVEQSGHRAVSREDSVSNPPAAVSKLGQFRSPHFALVHWAG